MRVHSRNRMRYMRVLRLLTFNGWSTTNDRMVRRRIGTPAWLNASDLKDSK